MALNDPKPRFQGQAILYPKMAKDTAIVTMEGKYETVPKLSKSTTFNDLE